MPCAIRAWERPQEHQNISKVWQSRPALQSLLLCGPCQTVGSVPLKCGMSWTSLLGRF